MGKINMLAICHLSIEAEIEGITAPTKGVPRLCIVVGEYINTMKKTFIQNMHYSNYKFTSKQIENFN